MKKFILTFVAAMAALVGAMAVPAFQPVSDGIMYQAVLRNDAGAVVASTEVDVTIELRNIMNVVAYSETHTATTDEFGLLTLKIGGGENTSQYLFEDIDWSYRYKVKIDVDVDGNGSADITCNEWLMDVPYAYYAKKSKDFQTSAAAKLTEDDVQYVKNMVGDMPMAKVTVSIKGLGIASEGWVEILGKRANASNESVTVNVPAYSPVYVSWNTYKSYDNIKMNAVYLNGVGVDRNAGTVEVEGTVTKRELVYLVIKATDWALVSEQYTTSKGKLEYGRFDESVITKNWDANKSKFTSMTADEYNALFNQSTYLNSDGDMNFTHPTETRLTAANSYIGVNFWTYTSKPGLVAKPVNSSAFESGKNFPIGPFDPTKENTIEVEYIPVIF